MSSHTAPQIILATAAAAGSIIALLAFFVALMYLNVYIKGQVIDKLDVHCTKLEYLLSNPQGNEHIVTTEF